MKALHRRDIMNPASTPQTPDFAAARKRYLAADANNKLAAAGTLLEAAELVLFAVTVDADNNNGKVDRHGIAATLRAAIAKARV